MKTYKYRCVVCTCLFASGEVRLISCPVCNNILSEMGHYDAKAIVGYVCKLCKKKNKKQLEESLQLFFREHMEDEHGSVELV